MNKTQFTSEIEARFQHYPPKGPEEIRIDEQVREICREAALQLVNLLPETALNSREFSLVLTDLENAMMHCNAAFARHKNG